MGRVQALVFCVLAGLVAISLGPARARADQAEPAGYRDAIEQALSEYELKNYEEASTLFARAHAIYPNARTLRGLGMAAFELRRYEESIGQLEAALASEVRPLDSALRAETEALLARARGFVASVTVELKPAEASLLVDGAPLAPRQGPLLLRLGEHALEAKLEGYKPERRTLRVRGGEVLRVNFELERELLAAPSVERPRAAYKSPWLWTAVGAVVVGAAVAGVVLALRDDDGTRVVATPSENTPLGVMLTSLGSR